jgi:hypothetical protein
VYYRFFLGNRAAEQPRGKDSESEVETTNRKRNKKSKINY